MPDRRRVGSSLSWLHERRQRHTAWSNGGILAPERESQDPRHRGSCIQVDNAANFAATMTGNVTGQKPAPGTFGIQLNEGPGRSGPNYRTLPRYRCRPGSLTVGGPSVVSSLGRLRPPEAWGSLP